MGLATIRFSNNIVFFFHLQQVSQSSSSLATDEDPLTAMKAAHGILEKKCRAFEDRINEVQDEHYNMRIIG